MGRPVTVVVDGEIVQADGYTVGWVVRRRVSRFSLRRRWYGFALYKPHLRTEPHRGRVAAACALARMTAPSLPADHTTTSEENRP